MIITKIEEIKCEKNTQITKKFNKLCKLVTFSVITNSLLKYLFALIVSTIMNMTIKIENVIISNHPKDRVLIKIFDSYFKSGDAM